MCGQYEGKNMSPVYLVEVVNPQLKLLDWTSQNFGIFSTHLITDVQRKLLPQQEIWKEERHRRMTDYQEEC
jgi:hypothetical protein